MCAVMSKPYGWDLRKTSKVVEKTQKDLFVFFSSKTVQAIETTFYSHSTSYYGTVCANRSKPYGWDLRKKAKISSKNTKKNFGLFIFPQKLCRRLKRFFKVILHHVKSPCVQFLQNRMAGICEKTPKVVQKTHKKNIFGLFIFPQKLCRRLKRLFTVILHHITAPCVQLDQNCMAVISGRRRKLVQKTQKNIFGFFIFP